MGALSASVRLSYCEFLMRTWPVPVKEEEANAGAVLHGGASCFGPHLCQPFVTAIAMVLAALVVAWTSGLVFVGFWLAASVIVLWEGQSTVEGEVHARSRCRWPCLHARPAVCFANVGGRRICRCPVRWPPSSASWRSAGPRVQRRKYGLVRWPSTLAFSAQPNCELVSILWPFVAVLGADASELGDPFDPTQNRNFLGPGRRPAVGHVGPTDRLDALFARPVFASVFTAFGSEGSFIASGVLLW